MAGKALKVEQLAESRARVAQVDQREAALQARERGMGVNEDCECVSKKAGFKDSIQPQFSCGPQCGLV